MATKVTIGSARIDERGKASGGKAGDQPGSEVSTQKWYKHSKDWVMLRCTIPGMGDHIADAMKAACKNNNIGYDQTQNSTLWDQVKDKGWDPAKVTKPTETDCARLVRVCVQYAVNKMGMNDIIPDFYTATLATNLVKTGFFKKHTESKYTTTDEYLQKGDILVTKTKGHTVIVLTNGSKAGTTVKTDKKYELGDRVLKNGMEGTDVKELQTNLIQLGYSVGPFGADGDFGDNTEIAVEKFQKTKKLVVDGIYGAATHKALMEVLKDDSASNAMNVKIINGNCYVRSSPNISGRKLGTARKGETYQYGGQKSVDGWYLITYKNQNGWVSGKYSNLIK